jgi:hypothetical protein
MATYRKTMRAAKELNTSYWRLVGLIRTRRLTPPEKDSSGDYIWSDSDMERAKAAFAGGKRQMAGLSTN